MRKFVGTVLFLTLWTVGVINICARRFLPHVFFTPGPECQQNIIAAINKAKKIDIAVYSITNPDICDAIIAAHRRGAKIKIITDRTQASANSSRIPEFIHAGIPVLLNKRTKLEHNKFAIFDDRTVVSGSYNWTRNASLYNSENCIFIHAGVNRYKTRFNQLTQIYK